MFYVICVIFFKQKTAYEMRISDWSSDVCSSDLFYAGITVDEMTCRFALDDCETAHQALAIVRRYGSLDYGYCHAGPPPGWDSSPASTPALHLLAGLLGELDRIATIMPEIVNQIDEDAVKRARAFIAMELPPGSREA